MNDITGNRIKFLDGLRGISIIAVLLHHALGPWNVMFSRNEFLPPNHELASNLFISYWYFGVELFFFISGFVIFITLEKCDNFAQFMLRRWIRLFPAMLICSCTVFLTAPLFPERPLGQPALSSMAPGLLFIDPAFIFKITGLNIPPLEGAFWSLFVEIRFYLIFGLLYFLLGKKASIYGLVTVFFIGLSIRFVHSVSWLNSMPWYAPIAHGVDVFYAATQPFGMGDSLYYGIFASGVLFSSYLKQNNARNLIFALTLSFISALVLGNSNKTLGNPTWGVATALIFIFAIPALCTTARFRSILSSKVLLFFGFVSYPLYLVHQNLMIATIIKLSSTMPWWLSTSLAISLVTIISWLVAKKMESYIKNKIRLTAKFIAQAI